MKHGINVYPFLSCFFDPSGNQTTDLTVLFVDILTELRKQINRPGALKYSHFLENIASACRGFANNEMMNTSNRLTNSSAPRALI